MGNHVATYEGNGSLGCDAGFCWFLDPVCVLDPLRSSMQVRHIGAKNADSAPWLILPADEWLGQNYVVTSKVTWKRTAEVWVPIEVYIIECYVISDI